MSRHELLEIAVSLSETVSQFSSSGRGCGPAGAKRSVIASRPRTERITLRSERALRDTRRDPCVLRSPAGARVQRGAIEALAHLTDFLLGRLDVFVGNEAEGRVVVAQTRRPQVAARSSVAR